jgi:hypothetical protein
MERDDLRSNESSDSGLELIIWVSRQSKEGGSPYVTPWCDLSASVSSRFIAE